MTTDSTQPDQEPAGWDLELGFWDWCRGIFDGKGDQMERVANPAKHELERRLDSVGWGLLFLLVGVLALPNGTAEYAFAAGIGATMLGLNVVRVLLAVPVRWFSIILGAAFLAGGIGALAGLHMDIFVLFFVVAGAVTIVGAILKPKMATEA